MSQTHHEISYWPSRHAFKASQHRGKRRQRSITHQIMLAALVSAVVGHANFLWSQDDNAPAEPPQDLQLFLLVGQSNMAGRGRIEKQDTEVHPRIWMLDRNGHWKPAVDPLHFDKPAIVGVGIGRSFALELLKKQPNAKIGLVPCAVGGSPIDAWKPGAYYKPTKSHPWDDAVRRAKTAARHGTWRGILWHQGESDSKPELAQAYSEKLVNLIGRFRKELGSTDIPFIAGQMGQFKERPWDEHKQLVDKAHRDLPKLVADSAFVNSDGLGHKGDEVHFNAAGYRELGRRYARAWLELQAGTAQADRLPFDVDLQVVRSGFDGEKCWVHARAGVIPASATPRREHPTVVMTMQELLLSGSDVFYALNEMRSEDGGRTWTGPVRRDSFARQPRGDNREITVCDFTPRWHAATGKLLGTGHTVWYENNRVMHVRPRATAYAVYDSQSQRWSAWKEMQLPDLPKFANAGAGSVQRFDLPNGDILLPIYYKAPEERQYSTTVLRCRFDGETLSYVIHGSLMTVPVKRGLYEPSVTRFGDRFYLTMRNDDHGYVAVGDDGLHYSEPITWKFDDGEDLGNYNTQQHWVAHSDGLFLVYTRRGANNDHVFRHRAPLFIAQVDPDSLRIIRSTERILVPEHGARLGNFAVAELSPHETLVTVTEWMQPAGVEKYGSDNRVYVAHIRWNRPNRLLTANRSESRSTTVVID